MTDSAWERALDLGGWGVFALVVIIGSRFVGQFFERALTGFEKALELNREALKALGEAVRSFTDFEREEQEVHSKIIEMQRLILDELRALVARDK